MAVLMRDMTGAGRKAAQVETPRGLVGQGRVFDFTPTPPEQDVLGNPLVLTDLPIRELHLNGVRAWLSYVLTERGMGWHLEERRMRWRVLEVIETLRLSVSPAAAVLADGPHAPRRRLPGSKKPLPIIEIIHPYQLQFAVDLLVELDDFGLANERKYLELLLAKIFQQYGEQASITMNKPFSFEHEARDYFYSGLRDERMLGRITDENERFSSLQNIYINYYHGTRYYIYALMRREKMGAENKLFFFYCRAIYFMARINWSGELQEKPPMRQLPERDTMMFYARRDRTVMDRYQGNPEFKAQVNSLLGLFPK